MALRSKLANQASRARIQKRIQISKYMLVDDFNVEFVYKMHHVMC